MNAVTLGIATCLAISLYTEINAEPSIDPKVKSIVDSMEWYNNAAFRITDGTKNIYIDIHSPVSGPKADVICFTHSHDDHFSALAVKNIIDTKKTVVIAPPTCNSQYLKEFTSNIKSLAQGDSIEINGIKIKAVYAYNIQKKNHTRNQNFLGYLITINGITIYHTGDTEKIPEMKDISCDIILLPLGQKYTMNSVEEAAESVLDVKAKVAIPMHWGQYEGTSDDVKKFQSILKDKITVIVKTAKS